LVAFTSTEVMPPNYDKAQEQNKTNALWFSSQEQRHTLYQLSTESQYDL